MISYTQREMQRQLISDQHLWKRLPAAAAAILWPAEAILFGWEAARWTGLATVVIVAMLATAAPPRISINLYLVDLLDRLLRLPLWLGWLLLIWQLSTREPILPVLGAPVIGAVLVTALIWLVSTVAVLLTGFATRRATARGLTPGA